MMLVETAHGVVREVFIAPELGAQRARQVGVLVGSIIVLLITRLLFRWLRVSGTRTQFMVGGFWVALTLLFELALGRAMHYPWPRLLSDYNPAQGGLMLLGLAVMFAAPWLISRWMNDWKR